jgi:pimeloyl-ACP methyl ester carboxylesterase
VRYRLTKLDALTTLWRTVDYNARRFTPLDLASWPGKTLLVLADDDPSTPAPVRLAVAALYPGARVHLFHGTGHAAALLKQDEYLAVIEEFIQNQ